MNKKLQIIAAVLSLQLVLGGCSESIQNAGYNTLLGMGMAFLVLIIIALVIRVLPMLTAVFEGKDNKKTEKLAADAIDNTISRIEEQETVSKDRTPVTDASDELTAVIAAAIAAYEADTGISGAAYPGTGYSGTRRQAKTVQAPPGYTGFFVRSIRRVPESNWKKR